MIEEVLDANAVEEQLPEDSSTPEQNDQIVSEDANPPDLEAPQEPEQPMPYHEDPAWKRIISERNELKDTVSTLSEQMQKLQSPNPTEPVEQIPDLQTPEDLANYLRQRDASVAEQVMQKLSAQEQAKVQEAQKVQQLIDNEIFRLHAEGKKFDDKELLSTMDSYGISDFNKGYEVMQALSKAKAQGEKEAMRKQGSEVKSSAQTKGTPSKSRSYDEIRNQSLDDIIAGV